MAKFQTTRATAENQWRWQPDRNPYLHNVFTILGLGDPDAPSEEFDRRLAAFAKRIRFKDVKPLEPFEGNTPTELDLAAAQDTAKSSNRLSEERLLAHKAHALDLTQLEEFIRLFEAMDLGKPEDLLPLPLTNVMPLAQRLPSAGALSPALVAQPDRSALVPLLKPVPTDERVLPR